MRRRPEAQEEGTARAFAPGHVTGLFAPSQGARDPRARGSIGAGIVLELGVHASARWRARGRGVRIVSDLGRELPISADVAWRLFGRRPGSLLVALRHELPIGQGFGTSAAGALATGFAVASAVGESSARAIEVAHLADLFGGGGLGGVAAILGGGFEVRLRPGIPPFGRVRHRPLERPLVLTVVGKARPSPALLGDPSFRERAETIARPLLGGLGAEPSSAAFLSAAEEFTDAVGLASPELRRLIRSMRRTGSRTFQTMFGECLVSVPMTPRSRGRLLALLTRRGLPSVELEASARGATSVAQARAPSARAFRSVAHVGDRPRRQRRFNRRPARPPPR